MATKTTNKTTKTANASQVEKDIRAFWFEHYPKRKSYSDDKRILLAQEFIDEQLELWGVYAYSLPDISVYHPAYYKTTSFKKTNIYDILGDFIAAVNDTDLEKYKPYPSYTEEQEHHRRKSRQRREVNFHELDDGEEYQPPNTISYDDLAEQQSLPLITHHVTVEQIAEIIDDLQADPFNEAKYLQSIYGGSAREIVRKIKGLKKVNIKVCKMCYEPFYARDKRIDVCDLTVKYRPVVADGSTRYVATKYSPCWHLRNAEKTRKNKGKTPLKINI